MADDPSNHAFRHEALFYAGDGEFVAVVGSFVRESIDAGEPVLVAVSRAKAELLHQELRMELSRTATVVRFADMAVLGSNPARIIPAWMDYVSSHGYLHRGLRGVGEPIWPGRSSAELVECQRHEELINVAFADGPTWRLLCPYDASTLDAAVLTEAQRSHPFLLRESGSYENAEYRGIDAMRAPFCVPLPEPPDGCTAMTFDAGSLADVRAKVATLAASAGLGASREEALVLACHEIATNSLRHGGGSGTIRMWAEDRSVVCEISDHGHLDQPLAGREPPSAVRANGRGLWLVHQLCDLVQVRPLPSGNVIRLHMRRQ